jgi:hypothetical protein
MATIVDLIDYIYTLRHKIMELEAENSILKQNLNNNDKKD